MTELTASSLKNMLWDTMQSLSTEKVQPAQADAMASQAREILRTIKLQLQIAQQSKRSVPLEIVTFSETK
jgi:hypothetical protein